MEHTSVVVTPTVVVQPETKQFYKTSEFWITMATNGLAMLAQVADILPPKYGLPLQGAVNMAYVLSRGIAKNGVAPVATSTPGPVIVTPPGER